MKQFLIILSLLFHLSSLAAAIPESGVSFQLAQWRSSHISSVSYDLSFALSSNKSKEIIAQETVAFNVSVKTDIALDFREEASKILRICRPSGKAIDCTISNEHIVIPSKYIRKGHNSFTIHFIAGNQSLNRNEDYLYTLYVPDRARTCFPCFDQPDIKASFTLHLVVPSDWRAVSNSPVAKTEGNTIHFAPTEPLSTYLFAFAAGKFQYQEYEEAGHKIGAYYRETDYDRIQQLPEIFHQIVYSLRWQEEFTGVPYGFSKYDFVVLPGFQFGGMEHTGCTFYNDNTLFLNENPTPDEILSRANLIAHETSHMWFGDLVTMKWFNDVWTKEVFANYFAAEIIKPMFPDYNFDLYWLQKFKAAAVEEDRTEGRTAIQQPLDNMNDAGLIYNNIIYNKAPLIMREIVRIMGKEEFRRGIQRYVQQFAYGNATWDDLINILNDETDVDLIAYSDRWVKTPYYPTLMANSYHPNPDGRAYGYFELTEEQVEMLMAHWPTETDATARLSYLMTLHENYLNRIIPTDKWMRFLIHNVAVETDPLTLSTLISYMSRPLWQLDNGNRAVVESGLWIMAKEHPNNECRLQLLRLLMANGASEENNGNLYTLWKYWESELLSEKDYMTLAYELAVRYPTMAEDIISEQRSRMDNVDRLRQFDFISRAVVGDKAAKDSLFQSLLIPENRRIEPWAGSVLYYLNHPLRDIESVKYIRPALEALKDVQRTGDIFFPGRWCNSLLRGHRSQEAMSALNSFLSENPDYPRLLLNKILIGAYNLQQSNQ